MPDEPKEQETQTSNEPDLKSELEQAREALKKERESAEARKRQYDLYRQQYEQQLRQRDEMLNQYKSSGGYGSEQEQSQPQRPAIGTQEYNQLREELAVVSLRQKYSDWDDKWPRVQELIMDNQSATEVAVFDQQGNPDFKKSLDNAYTRIQVQELRKAQEAAEQAKQKHKEEQNRLKNQGPSGVTASEPEEEIDLEGLSSDDMIKQGLVKGPEGDPIKPRKA